MSAEFDDAVDPLYVDRFAEAVVVSLENLPLYDRRDWLETFLYGVQIKIERRIARNSFEEFTRDRLRVPEKKKPKLPPSTDDDFETPSWATSRT
jgi:hypothetical protein